MTEKRKDRCETCRWYEENPEYYIGTCHRYPPHGDIRGGANHYTAIVPDNWCGEWRKRR